MRYRDLEHKPLKASDKENLNDKRYHIMLRHYSEPNVKPWYGLNDSPYAPKKAVE